jgi:hypothetical protein
MIRILACVATLILTTLIAVANPARPLYVPTPPKPPAPPIDLRGTTWRGMDLVADRVMIFNADGSLHYGVGAKPTNFKASWKLDGHDLYFEMNNQYREFKGKVIGDTIVGQSWNRVNKKWETTLRRDRNGK